MLGRGLAAAGGLAALCAVDLIGQREAPYAPSLASPETLARSDAYLAANVAPLPEGWRWERRDVPDVLGPGGFVRVGGAGPEGAPTVLFVPGFTGTAEQYADYYAAWRARGWRAVSLDLPGQGGSARRRGNPEKPWPGDFGAYADAVAPVLAEEAAKGPLVVVGESFGGHVTLRALAEGAPDATHLADAAVLVVPALDANLDGRPRALTLAAAHAATALGLGDAYVPGAGPWQADWTEAGAGDFTGRCGDRADRIYGQAALYALRPELRVSGPSWGWLAGMQASGAALARPGALDAVTIPVRMVQSGQDQVIENGRATTACANMADCQRLVWDDASHCLGVEEDEVQERLHGVIAAAVADAVESRAGRAGGDARALVIVAPAPLPVRAVAGHEDQDASDRHDHYRADDRRQQQACKDRHEHEEQQHDPSLPGDGQTSPVPASLDSKPRRPHVVSLRDNSVLLESQSNMGDNSLQRR